MHFVVKIACQEQKNMIIENREKFFKRMNKNVDLKDIEKIKKAFQIKLRKSCEL